MFQLIGKPEETRFLTDVVQFKKENSTLLLIRWKVCVLLSVFCNSYYYCCCLTDHQLFIWLLFDQTQCEF